MALSDYNNPVEKIAALKAATLDPSLIQYEYDATKIMSVTETIYLVHSPDGLYLIDGIGGWKNLEYDLNSVNSSIRPFYTGVDIAYGHSILYIKDADIVYPDPIKTYQTRLAACYTTPTTTVIDASFTTGVYGSIALSSYIIQRDGQDVFDAAGLSCPIPLPPSTEYVVPEASVYFDVPADW